MVRTCGGQASAMPAGMSYVARARWFTGFSGLDVRPDSPNNYIRQCSITDRQANSLRCSIVLYLNRHPDFVSGRGAMCFRAQVHRLISSTRSCARATAPSFFRFAESAGRKRNAPHWTDRSNNGSNPMRANRARRLADFQSALLKSPLAAISR